MPSRKKYQDSNAELQAIDRESSMNNSKADPLRLMRDHFVEETEARLETLDHELGRLNQQAVETGAELHHGWEMTWRNLQQTRRAAQDRLRDVSTQSSHTWHHLAAGVDNVRQDLAAAIARARDEFNLRR